MKKIRGIFSFIIVLTLLLSLTTPAFAATYDLEQGDISVSADGTGQTVTQNGVTTQDNDVTITSNDNLTSNTISLSSTNGATAVVTLKEVIIAAVNKNGIDVVGDSSAVINVEGYNEVIAESDDPDYEYTGQAAIHVSEGSLTITGVALMPS